MTAEPGGIRYRPVHRENLARVLIWPILGVGQKTKSIMYVTAQNHAFLLTHLYSK